MKKQTKFLWTGYIFKPCYMCISFVISLWPQCENKLFKKQSLLGFFWKQLVTLNDNTISINCKAQQVRHTYTHKYCEQWQRIQLLGLSLQYAWVCLQLMLNLKHLKSLGEKSSKELEREGVFSSAQHAPCSSKQL